MNLLPRDDFQQQVKLICQAAALLVEGAAAGNAHLANAAHQIHVLEQQADNVLHETFTRLNSTFITPLDPEDIQSLSSHLNDVIDGIEDSVHRMLDYHIDPMPSIVMELCCIVQSCCGAGRLAVKGRDSIVPDLIGTLAGARLMANVDSANVVQHVLRDVGRVICHSLQRAGHV
jgi:hypothetical protein